MHQKGAKYAKKSEEQVKILQEEFLADPNWNKATVQRISQRVNLSFSVVYKWCWDQRKLLKGSAYGFVVKDGFLTDKKKKNASKN